MVQLQRPRRLFDAGSFGLGGALSTRFRPVDKAGERHEARPLPPAGSSANGGYGGGGSSDRDRDRDLEGYAYERSLPTSSNPYAIPAAVAASPAGPAGGAQQRGGGGREARQQQAAANGGAGSVPASQAAFATQMQSQQGFATQSFAGLSQDTFAAPSQLDFGQTQHSQQPGLSQAMYDSYFQQQQEQDQQGQGQ
jgi:regulator of nonsense transcripts 1